MHASLRQLQHRPWPIPSTPWVLFMGWDQLLFLHWPVDPVRIQSLLPTGVELDCYEGQAYLGVVPFLMRGTQPRGFPAIPGLATFPEVNVRTYVRVNGRPGVWFFSLDASSRIAVGVARRFFHLPYHHAEMSLKKEGDWVRYSSRRYSTEATFEARYRADGPVDPPATGSLEHFLVERYCLYSAMPDGRILRGDVHHVPWPLQRAEVDLISNTMCEPIGLRLLDPPQLAHFSSALDAHAWRATPEKGVGPII